MLSTQGEATKVKGMKDLMMYTYMSDTRATIVVDNKVRDKKQSQYTRLIVSILQSKEGYLDRINKLFVSFQSYSSVRLNLDCSGSRNCLTNQPSLDETFSVKSQSQIVSFFLTHLL